MFGFLKDKLKNALGKFSKDVEKESIVEKKEVIVEEKILEKKIETVEENKPKNIFQKIFGKKEQTPEYKEELIERAEEREIETIEETKTENIKEEAKSTIHKPIHNESITLTISEEKKEKHLIKTEPTQNKDVKSEKKAPSIEIKQKAITRNENVEEKYKSPQIDEKQKTKNEPVRAEVHNIETKSKTREEQEQITEKEVIHEPQEKKSFFTKITETFTKFNISEEKFEELFWDLEVAMLENNVAVEVIEKIKKDMKKELMSGKINRKGVDEMITQTLKKSIIELFDIGKRDLVKEIKKKEKKPYVITIIGVNGSGKTTSIAKLTHLLQKNGLSVVLAASDTFRAAAIQQLEEHANNLKVKIIKHDYNSDPAAVAFDAIKYGEAKNIDVVIIDTAGRLHSNTNLMEELKKVVRVCKPDIKIFVGESITGNDCVEQAKEFDKAVGIDAIILAKADVDEKGGAAISVSYVTQKPILYLGTGQTYDDLKEFNSQLIIDSLEL